MQKIAALVLMLLLVVGCSSRTTSTDSGPFKAIFEQYPELKDHAYTSAEVKRVVDGDTFETKNGDKVRLIGVNTPETVKPGSPVEAYGKEASAYTKGKLTGQTVYLFKDTGDKDKYDRLLRYVFVKGETDMFNEVLVKEGYANVMTVPPNVLLSKKFAALEKTARQKKKGLWRDDK